MNVFYVTNTYHIRITPSTDPDWDGAATEQTDIHLYSTRLFKIKGAIFIYNSCNHYHNFTFSKTIAVFKIEIDNVNEFA